jgi:hypothetical protein
LAIALASSAASLGEFGPIRSLRRNASQVGEQLGAAHRGEHCEAA